MEDQNKAEQDNNRKGPISSGMAPGPGEHLLDQDALPTMAAGSSGALTGGIGGSANNVSTGRGSSAGATGTQDSREWHWPRSETMATSDWQEGGSRTMLQSMGDRVRGSRGTFIVGSIAAGFLLQRILQAAPAQKLGARRGTSEYGSDASLDSERQYGVETAYAPEADSRSGYATAYGSTSGSTSGGTAADTIGRLGERVKQAGGNARESLRATTDQARARLQDMSERTRNQYSLARDRVDTMKQERPLMIGALGIALGAGLGAMMAVTRRERELMGEARDKVLGKAKETAMQQMQSVKESAQRVADFAKQEAQRKKDELAASAGDSLSSPGQRTQ